jgi:hypothetical protein
MSLGNNHPTGEYLCFSNSFQHFSLLNRLTTQIIFTGKAYNFFILSHSSDAPLYQRFIFIQEACKFHFAHARNQFCYFVGFNINPAHVLCHE